MGEEKAVTMVMAQGSQIHKLNIYIVCFCVSPCLEMKAHEFVVRKIAPYSGSVVFVLYKCPKTSAGDYMYFRK